MNRTLNSQLNGIFPYEILIQKSPEFNQLKVFGCLCFAKVVPHPTDKFALRSFKRVFVGYPFAKKEYRVIDLQTRHLFISRDVVFNKSIFPFKDIHTPSIDQLYPTLQNYTECDPLFVASTVEPTIQSNDELIVDQSLVDHSETLSVPTTVSTIPQVTVSSRPQRGRHIPTKYSDFTGLPSHLVNAIQL